MAAEQLYQAFNGPAPTTAAQVPVTTGAVIKTLLQLATPATTNLYIVEYGVSFDGSAAATPIKVELFSCAGAATVTALAAADIAKLTDPLGPASTLTLSTTGSGYTASAEGTVSAAAMFDAQHVAPTAQYVKQWPLGREPQVAVSRFVRIRVTAPVGVNAYAYIIWGE